MAHIRKFVRIIRWEEFQYGERTKKPVPPWPWFKTQTKLLDDPTYLSLCEGDRGAMWTLCMLAARYANWIQDDSEWLRRSYRLRSRYVTSLVSHGFVERFTMTLDSNGIRALGHVYGEGPVKDREQSLCYLKSESLKSDVCSLISANTKNAANLTHDKWLNDYDVIELDSDQHSDHNDIPF